MCNSSCMYYREQRYVESTAFDPFALSSFVLILADGWYWQEIGIANITGWRRWEEKPSLKYLRGIVWKPWVQAKKRGFVWGFVWCADIR